MNVRDRTVEYRGQLSLRIDQEARYAPLRRQLSVRITIHQSSFATHYSLHARGSPFPPTTSPFVSQAIIAFLRQVPQR